MTIRQEIQDKIQHIRARAAADKAHIQSVADAQIAELQAFINSSPPLLGQELGEVRNMVSKINTLLSK